MAPRAQNRRKPRSFRIEFAPNQHRVTRRHHESRRLQVAHFVFGPDNRQQSTRTQDVLPRSRRVKAGGHAPLAIGLAFAVMSAIALGPDLVRYMKIRAM
jgi:hypothetical protein